MSGVQLCLLCCFALSCATSGDTVPIRRVIATLVAEARAGLRAGELPRSDPTFATTCDGVPPMDDLLDALTRPAHRDPLVDAYVRWQLTGFGPDLTRLDDDAFMNMVRTLPAPPPNPRADPDLVAEFETLDPDEPMRPREIDRWRERIEALDRRTVDAETWRRPALGFAESIQDRLGERGLRPHLWRLVRVESLVAAGWPAPRLKGEVTTALTGVRRDATITDEQRTWLGELIDRFDRPPRPLVGSVTWLAGGRARVDFDRVGVSAANRRTWRRRVRDGPP